MWALVLLLSAAVGSEIGLNATSSSTSSSSQGAGSSTPSLSSSTSSQAGSSTPSITAAPSGSITILPDPYGIPCSGTSDYCRACNRLPEQPYLYYCTTSFLNPWLPNQLIQNYYTNSTFTTNTICSAQFDSQYSSYIASAPLTAQPRFPSTGSYWTNTVISQSFPYTTISGQISDLPEIASTTLEYYAAYTPYLYASHFTLTATSPCCSSCTVYGGDIQVMYWAPTSALPTGVTTLVNSAGFTFTSPSVYVALKSLNARDLCGTVGTGVQDTTIAFAPGALTTAPAYHFNSETVDWWDGSLSADFQPATWGTAICQNITTTIYQDQIGDWTLTGPLPASVISTTIGGVLEYGTVLGDGASAVMTYNPCSPYLSIPTQLLSADPLWTSCGPILNALLFDPPYVLSAVSGLSPVTIADPQSQGTTSISAAAAGATIPVVTPSPTSTVAAVTLATSSAAVVVIPPKSTSSTNDPAQPASTSQIASPKTTTTVANPVQPASTSQIADPKATTTANPQQPTTTTPILATLFSQTLTVNPTSSYLVIGTQTLHPGSSITVSGTTIALASNGATLAVGTSAQVLTSAKPQSTQAYVIGSQTLVPGGAPITISGTVVSLQATGSNVVIAGTKTEPLASLLGGSVSTVAGGGLGGVIVSIGGFGGAGSTTTSAAAGASTSRAFNGTAYTGGAGRGRDIGRGWLWGLGGLVVGVFGVFGVLI